MIKVKSKTARLDKELIDEIEEIARKNQISSRQASKEMIREYKLRVKGFKIKKDILF